MSGQKYVLKELCQKFGRPDQTKIKDRLKVRKMPIELALLPAKPRQNHTATRKDNL